MMGYVAMSVCPVNSVPLVFEKKKKKKKKTKNKKQKKKKQT